MKKIVSVLLAIALCVGACFSFAACGAESNGDSFTVGVCQLMEHESLDKATNGFVDALKAEM